MTAALSSEFANGFLVIDIDGVASTANAGQGSILNPFGCDVNIVRAFLVPKSESTGSSNLSIGITTVSASATDILNADDMNGVTEGKAINCFAQDPGAKTEIVPALWESDKYITFTASATLVGFEGALYLEVLRDTEANA